VTQSSPNSILHHNVGSSYERVSCDQCFKTLDPNAGDSLNSAFVHCGLCGGNFHAEHVQNHCPKCGSNKILPAKVISPPSLKDGRTRRPIELTPIRMVDGQINSDSFNLVAYWAVARHGIRLTVLGLLALVFIAIAGGIGAYTSRWVDVYQQSPQSSSLPEQLLNRVLREEPPRQIIFQLSIITAVVTAYALFPSTLRNKQGNRDVMRWVSRVAGGAIFILGINIILFNIDIVDYQELNSRLASLLSNRTDSREIILAEIGAIGATMIFAIPYLIITRNSPIPPSYPLPLNIIRILIGLFRYILVFYAIIRLIVSIGAIQLGSEFSFVASLLPRKLGAPTDSEARIAILTLCAVAVGLLLYHIPHYRLAIPPTNPVNLMLRILGCFGCLVLAGFIYSRVNSDLLIEAAIFGAAFALVFWPTHRAYA